jgi:HAD superfamily hydrolase (TIGR01509 family)
MIKSIIFDLDGVIVDTKDLHFKALNKALLKSKNKYQISYTDHLKNFDGLPTSEKLNILIKGKLIKSSEKNKIIIEKKKLTTSLIKQEVKFDNKINNLFKKLSKKFSIAIATNSINTTLDHCIKVLKLKKYLSFKIGTDNLRFKKPHPEIYLRCLVELGMKPSEALIIEDSHVGRSAVKESGSNLFPVKDLNDVTYKKIMKYIDKKNSKKTKKNSISWDDEEMNILIPMAGLGSRFKKAGYTFPKPLIEVHNKPMIQWVIEGLNIKANYIFIIQKSHQQKYNIKSLLKAIQPTCKIIEISKITEGAACTTLLAKKYINNNKPLVIANSDQFIEWSSSKIMYKFTSKKVDGGILVFKSIHPKWSYAKTNKSNEVIEVAEKKVISDNATVGVYYWRKGSDYVKYSEKMIKKNIRVNNEFYVCPVFNEAILNNQKIIIEKVDKMWGLGTPEDLSYFLQEYKA